MTTDSTRAALYRNHHTGQMEPAMLQTGDRTPAGWQSIDTAQPPKDEPFLASNSIYGLYLAEWSTTDESYLHLDSLHGWLNIPIDHWMHIPPIPDQTP